MNSFSIKTKILLSMTLLLAFTLAITLVSVNLSANSAASKLSASTKERTEILLNKTLKEETQKLSALSTLISNQPGTKSVLQADFVTISEYLTSLASKSGVDFIYIVGESGEIVGKSSGSILEEKCDVSKMPSIQAGLNRKNWSGLDSLEKNVDARSVSPIVRDGYLRGVLVVGDYVDEKYLREIGNSAGVQLAFDGVGNSPADSEMISWKSEIRANLHSVPLKLSAGFPSETVLAPFDSLKQSLSILVGIAMLFASGLSILIAISISKPISKLASAANQMREGIWPEPFNSSSKDEIGLLMGSFDTMSQDLQANIGRLSSMLQIDPLTELLNHREFRHRLELESAQSEKFGYDLSLILFDIDHFEDYNRVHGAEKGDDLLVSIANILREMTPQSSLIGRHSGDEMIVLLQGVNCEEIAESVRKHIEASLGVTVTVGCVSRSEKIQAPDVMIMAVKMAVNQAKVAGKNRVRRLTDLPEFSSIDDFKAALSGGSYTAVRALAEAVDAKDEYTRGHSQRVAEYARDLARYCGHDEGYIELIYVTGTLHDVGKIGVPDSALKKPGKLTDEEFEMIKLHPALGEKIVSQIPQLAETLPGIRSHHERYDGRGYPDKLAGEEISLMGRILAIADTYDAMTSDRPYRKGLDVDFALSEIEKGAGTQFDPELASKFVAMFKERLQSAA